MAETAEPDSETTSMSGREKLVTAVLMIAALMDFLDGSIVNVALPTIRAELGADATAVRWIVSGYMLAFAAGLVIAGRLGDLFGERRLFLLGVAAFTCASLAAGLAQTPGQLVGARLAQGLAAATVAPQVLASLRALFSGSRRASVFGVYGALAGLATAAAVILGGVLTQVDIFGLGWRAVFLINVPVSLFVLLLGLRVLPETKGERTGRMDVLGSVTLVAGLTAVSYPLLEGQHLGWPWWCWLLIVAGVLALLGLGLLEPARSRAGVAPLLQSGLFAIPAFSAGIAIQLVFSLAMQGLAVAMILWLQSGRGFTPLQAGLTLLWFSVGGILTAPTAGTLALTRGRKVLVLGALTMAAGTTLLGVVVWNSGASVSSWALGPGLLMAGAGLGWLIVPLVNVVLTAVPADGAGGASGIFSTAQQFGGALGVALLGMVFFNQLASGGYDSAIRATLPWTVGAYLVCAALCLLLPRTAISEEEAANLLP